MMVSRADLSKWKPKREDGWRTCEAVTGNCSCLKNKSGPCHAWAIHLRDCYIYDLDPVDAEITRIKYNTKHNKYFDYASSCVYRIEYINKVRDAPKN